MARSTAGGFGTGTEGSEPTERRWLKRLGLRCARRRSARTYITGLLIALLLPMLVFSAFAMFRMSERERLADRRDVESTARALSAVMDLKMEKAVAALGALAISHALEAGEIPRFYAKARQVAAAHQGWILLANPDGMGIFTTREPLGRPPRLLKSAAIVRTVVQTHSIQISGVFVGATSTVPQVSAYVPVMRGDQVSYVLLMSFNMRELSQALLDQNLPPDWTVQVMDRGHHVIARNRPMDASEPIAEWSPPEGARDTFTVRDDRGEEALAALARSKFTGWSLAVMIPRSEIYSPFYRSLAELGVSAGVLLLLGVAVAALIDRSIARPMRGLSVAAAALGRGDPLPSIATPVSELHDVMTALAAAAGQLREQSRERSAAEAAMRRSEQRFRDIAETSGDWIWESDTKHRLTYFSKTSSDVFGRDPRELLGHARWEFDTGNDGEFWAAHRSTLEAHLPFRQLRYSLIGRDGKTVHYCVSGRPVFGETGEFQGYRGTATNETEAVEARAKVERAETLLQDALDSISAGVLIFDADDRLIMANEAWHQIYRTLISRDLDGDSSIGKTFEEGLREGIAAGQYAAAIGFEEEWVAERLRLHRSGTVSLEQQVGDRWLLMIDRPMRNGGVAGLRVDITELKRAQAALQASEERLDRAQRIAGIGSFELDVASGQYTWSKEMFRIRGFPEDAPQPTMSSLVRTIHEEDFPKVHAWLKQLREGGEPSAVEFRIHRPDGEERIINSEGRAIRDDKGAVAKVIGTAQDLTDARRTEQARQELERQLRHSQKLEALGTLAGGIAHDLNNTLVPVVAITKLALKRAGEDAQMKQYLGLIKDAGDRARDLVKRVLAFSRNDRAEKREFSIADVVCEALAMLRATLPSTIALVSDIRPVPTFVGDPSQIHQIVVNLVTNAMHAIGGNTGTISVSLTPMIDPARQKPATIRLVVSDTGCGMDEATARRIFEPFFTTKGVGEGTGLGLSVVHGIITGHGGTIRVESRPGHGARFIIDLPTASDERIPFVAKAPAA